MTDFLKPAEAAAIGKSLLKRVFPEVKSVFGPIERLSHERDWSKRVQYEKTTRRLQGDSQDIDNLYNKDGVFGHPDIFFRPTDRIAVLTDKVEDVEGLKALYPGCLIEMVSPESVNSANELKPNKYDRLIIEGFSENVNNNVETIAKLASIVKDGGMIKATMANGKHLASSTLRTQLLSEQGFSVYEAKYANGNRSDVIVGIKGIKK